MFLIYQSKNYRPDLVTGRYVRCNGSKAKGYKFRIFETATGQRGPGMGGTLREYETAGAELPDDLRERLIRTKQTEAWPLAHSKSS